MTQGLSAQDLRQRAQVQTLRRNGNNGHQPEEDPLDKALEMQRKIAAQQIIQRSVSDTGVAATQAEIERLRAEAEKAKLLAESKSPQQNDMAAFFLSQIEKLQSQLNDTQKALSEQQAAFLQDRLAQLTAQLQALQEGRPEPVNPIVMAKQSIQDAKELVDLFTPPPAPAAETPVADTAEAVKLQAWTTAKQLEHKRWEIERADKREEVNLKLTLEREVRQAELNLKAQHDERMDRFFTETAPKFLEVGQRLLDQLMAGRSQLPATPVAAPAALPQVAPPEGTETARCEACGSTAFFFDLQRGALICQQCGASYQLNEVPDETQETARHASDPNEGISIV